MLSRPKFKSYELDYMIDSGFQMNLEKGNAIQFFYWEEAKEHGVAIEGTNVQLKDRVPYFPISIGRTK